MKSRRFRSGYRANASKLHRAVGDTLRDPASLFAGHRVYQEYPVKLIDTSFFSGAYKFDWVDLDLKLVVECHGAQHYVPTDFGGRGSKQAEENFAFVQASDFSKKSAALRAGWTYVVVPHWEQGLVSADYLWSKYLENFNNFRPEKASKKEESEYKIKEKAKAREYRRQQYLRAKEFKKKRGVT